MTFRNLEVRRVSLIAYRKYSKILIIFSDTKILIYFTRKKKNYKNEEISKNKMKILYENDL